MKRYLSALLLAVFLTTTGCAQVMNVLPHIIAAVTDAVQVLDAIEAFVREYFLMYPDKDKETQVSKAMAKTRAALNFALRAVDGTEKLNQQNIDAAFADFKVAYQELMVLVGPLGVQSAGVPATVLVTGKKTLIVPSPLAMKMKVTK